MTKVWEDSRGKWGGDSDNPAAPRQPGLLIRHLDVPHSAAFHLGKLVIHERVRAGFAELHLNEPALRWIQIECLRVTAGFPIRVSAVPKQVAAFLIVSNCEPTTWKLIPFDGPAASSQMRTRSPVFASKG